MFRKQGFAMLTMVVLIVGATLFGSYRSMQELTQSALRVFYEGAEADGFGIQHDLEERISLAFNLTTIAQSYVSAQSIDDVLQARQSLLEAQTISQKYEANLALTQATKSLYELLGQYSLSENHATYRERIDVDLRSRNAIISHDPYNEVASNVNRKLNAIPARWLRQLVGIKEVELFR